jgi:hypothetical protein
VRSLLLRDKRDFAANGALIIRGALDEAEPPQLVIQREMMRRIAWTGVQAADAINPSGFLRARHERPRGRSAAEQRDELAASHSITSSARASSVGSTSRPRALAVLRLTTVRFAR